MPIERTRLPTSVVAELRHASLNAQLELKRKHACIVTRRALYDIGEQILHQQYAFSGGRFPETPADLLALYDLLHRSMIKKIMDNHRHNT